jgi:ribonuclease HI
MPRPHSDDLFPHKFDTPDEYILAHIDGGSRGNPGPAGYGVVITDHHRQKIAGLSEYLGHQTNNYAEYSGLLAALDYALQHGHKALKVVGDSELLVKQIRGEYKVKSPALQDLYLRARRMIAKLDWFSIQHVLREKNHEADRLANLAMDKGMGRVRPEAPSNSSNHDYSARTSAPTRTPSGLAGQEFRGVVREGVIVLENATLPEGTRVQIRVRD